MSAGAIFCLIVGGLTAVMVAYLVGGLAEASKWRKAGLRFGEEYIWSGNREWQVMPLDAFESDYVFKGFVVGGMWSPTDEDLERWGAKKGAA